KIQTYRRAVHLTGTLTANPDSPTATPYFGTVSETTLAGRLIYVVNKKSGSPCKPPKPQCTTGVALAWFDATNPAVVPQWVAGYVTIAGTTQYVMEGIVVDTSNPSVFALRLLAVITPDSTWFTSAADLTTAHADTGILSDSRFTGATDYAYNGTAAT